MSALVAAALALAGACGGSSDATFDEDDAMRILRPPSAAPAGSSWVKHEASAGSVAQLRAQLRQAGRSTGTADALEEAGLSRLYERGWRLSRGSEAFASAAFFKDAAGAENGFDTLQRISPNWIATIPVDELGEQAVGGRSSDTGAGFTWRRENLILSVSLFRSRGPAFDYERAARAYANELDERAAQAK
jgi:hypothetical protein